MDVKRISYQGREYIRRNGKWYEVYRKRVNQFGRQLTRPVVSQVLIEALNHA